MGKRVFTADMQATPKNRGEPAVNLPACRLTVLYDGDCAMCRREIAHYRRLDKQRRVNWADIACSADLLDQHGITVAAAYLRLHVIDAGGQLHTGVAAFVRIWAELPGYRWLARLVKFLHLERLLELGYTPLTRWRLRNRCLPGGCELP